MRNYKIVFGILILALFFISCGSSSLHIKNYKGQRYECEFVGDTADILFFLNSKEGLNLDAVTMKYDKEIGFLSFFNGKSQFISGVNLNFEHSDIYNENTLRQLGLGINVSKFNFQTRIEELDENLIIIVTRSADYELPFKIKINCSRLN